MDELAGFCRSMSLAAQEPQFGTAVASTDAWFVLEYDGPWAAKAWQNAELPAAVREHVDAWAVATPGARIQLARRDDRKHRRDVVVLLANTRQSTECVAEYRLPTVDELTTLDLTDAFSLLRQGRLPPDAVTPQGPVVLVCTNGKRDRCCAKWGTAVYQSLAAEPRVQAWQTTHLGGHRFAATMLWLPTGLCHGRVASEHTRALVEAALGGEVGPLALLRGRACLPAAGQAAEALWRLERGLTGISDVKVEQVVELGDEIWQVVGHVSGRNETMRLREQALGQSSSPSCGAGPEPILGWVRC